MSVYNPLKYFARRREREEQAWVKRHGCQTCENTTFEDLDDVHTYSMSNAHIFWYEITNVDIRLCSSCHGNQDVIDRVCELIVLQYKEG